MHFASSQTKLNRMRTDKSGRLVIWVQKDNNSNNKHWYDYPRGFGKNYSSVNCRNYCSFQCWLGKASASWACLWGKVCQFFTPEIEEMVSRGFHDKSKRMG